MKSNPLLQQYADCAMQGIESCRVRRVHGVFLQQLPGQVASTEIVKVWRTLISAFNVPQLHDETVI
jgi:hypothetical protein